MWTAHNTVGVSSVMLESPTPLSQVNHSYNEPLLPPDLILNDNQSSAKWPRTVLEFSRPMVKNCSETVLDMF